VSGVFIFQVAIISRGKILSEPIYKPNSVSRKSRLWSFIWSRPRGRDLATNPRVIMRRTTSCSPTWSCTGWGLHSSQCYHRDWWSFTPPFHLYPENGIVCSLLHFPYPGTEVPEPLPLGGILSCGVRTFLPIRQ